MYTRKDEASNKAQIKTETGPESRLIWSKVKERKKGITAKQEKYWIISEKLLEQLYSSSRSLRINLSHWQEEICLIMAATSFTAQHHHVKALKMFFRHELSRKLLWYDGELGLPSHQEKLNIKSAWCHSNSVGEVGPESRLFPLYKKWPL